MKKLPVNLTGSFFLNGYNIKQNKEILSYRTKKYKYMPYIVHIPDSCVYGKKDDSNCVKYTTADQ